MLYRVQDGTLLRQTAGGGGTDEPAATLATVPLLAGVRAVRFRLWRDGAGWLEPGADAAAPAVPGPGPLNPPGVEIVLERPDGSQLRRVLLVG